ncbi:Bax inhibitor-1/YccA family protein [Pelosinus sp. sgz500959]|uniref:Bax inhibitor-1/YccA family protein n=1 Tax=Pelosinus sp. sgz500959 TaxID=3242472 RepID=UPI00366B96AF
MRNSNPVFNNNLFTRPQGLSGNQTMTVSGTITKSFYSLFLVVLSALSTWLYLMVTHNFQTVAIFSGMGTIVSFIIGFIVIFKPQTGHITVPLYSIFQGFALGAVTTLLSQVYSGIAFQAVALTMGVALSMLVSYKFGLIQATEKFRSILTIATGGIFVVYMASMLLGFFGIHLPFLRGGMFGIVFSLVVIGIAALNLILDFDNIERGANSGAPAYMEWIGAFGLMVTLIWLYWEIIRLISILRGDDD